MGYDYPGDTPEGDHDAGDLHQIECLPEEDPGDGCAENRCQAEQQQAETRTDLVISLEQEGVSQGEPDDARNAQPGPTGSPRMQWDGLAIQDGVDQDQHQHGKEYPHAVGDLGTDLLGCFCKSYRRKRPAKGSKERGNFTYGHISSQKNLGSYSC